MTLYYSPSLRIFTKSLTDLRQVGLLSFNGPTETISVIFVEAGGGELALAGSLGVLGVSANVDLDTPIAWDSAWTLAVDSKSAVFNLTLDTVEARAALVAATNTQNFFVDAVIQLDLTVSGGSPQYSKPTQVRVFNSVVRTDSEPPTASSSAFWAFVKSAILAGTNVTRAVDEEAKTLTLSSSGSGGGSLAWADITGKPASLCFVVVSDDGVYLEFRNLAGTLVGKSILNA